MESNRGFTVMIVNAAKARSAQPEIFSRLWHGAAYYPELWPDSEMEGDLEAMKKIGLDVVRIGEFAWADMEPSPGEYRFEQFRGFLDRIHEAGFRVILGTPTATPPIWLTHGHPERRIHDEEGDSMVHGGRQHLAIDDSYVRDRCRRIVKAMGEALGDHPSVIAWQIDNEFKCDTDTDFGPSALTRWPEWLRDRYGSIEGLNQAWGTGIWSQRYRSFEEIPPPLKCPGLHNASLELAWKRFSRDRIIDFLREQCATLRSVTNKPVTHNSGILFRINQEDVAEGLDFVSFDHYADEANLYRMVLNYDFWRNVHPTRRFWLMETSSGHNGSLIGFHKHHRPGFLVAEGVAAYALGGTAFCYWVWRQQRSGAELTHGCLRQAWGTPSSGAADAEKLSAARKILDPVLRNAEPRIADTALLWSDTARMMIQVEPHNGLVYSDLMIGWVRRLRRMGFHLDVIGERGSLEERRLLFTPFAPALPEDFLARAEKFVRAGGTWVVGPMTGLRTLEHTVPTDAGLGPLEKLAGVRTIHTCPVGGGDTSGVAWGNRAELDGWAALLEANEGTEVIGRVEGGPGDGRAFLTRRRLGEGWIVVLGSWFAEGPAAESLLQILIARLSGNAGVRDRFPASPGIIVAPWIDGEREIWVCVEMDGKGGEVFLPTPGMDACSGEPVKEGFQWMEPFSFRCFSMGTRALEKNSPSRELGERELEILEEIRGSG